MLSVFVTEKSDCSVWIQLYLICQQPCKYWLKLCILSHPLLPRQLSAYFGSGGLDPGRASPSPAGQVGGQGHAWSGTGSSSISILLLRDGSLKGPEPRSRKADLRVVKEDAQLLAPWWLAQTKVSLRKALFTSKVKCLWISSGFFLYIPPSHSLLPPSP